MTTRRSLITGLASLIAAPSIVKAGSIMPVVPWRPLLIGDGVHDDTEGLQAFFDGRPVRIAESLTREVFMPSLWPQRQIRDGVMRVTADIRPDSKKMRGHVGMVNIRVMLEEGATYQHMNYTSGDPFVAMNGCIIMPHPVPERMLIKVRDLAWE